MNQENPSPKFTAQSIACLNSYVSFYVLILKLCCVRQLCYVSGVEVGFSIHEDRNHVIDRLVLPYFWQSLGEERCYDEGYASDFYSNLDFDLNFYLLRHKSWSCKIGDVIYYFGSAPNFSEDW